MPGRCFYNASHFAAHNLGWYYVEGVALFEGVKAHHAWVASSDDGSALEVTWDRPGSSYFGVPLDGETEEFLPALTVVFGGTSLVSSLLRSTSRTRSVPGRGIRRPPGWGPMAPA